MMIKVPNAKLSVTVQGTGRPIVFMNGYGSYKEIWTAQLTAFSRQVQTVAFDDRGQGESTGSIATSLTQLADDLAVLLADLKLDRPLLVAHSMGASVLWAFRQQYPKIPVSGLMVVDQSPKMINTPDWPFGYHGLTSRTVPVQLRRPRAGHETLHGMAPAVINAFIRAENRQPFARTDGLALLKDHFEADWRGMVLQETMPTLFVTATQTPYFNNGYGQWLIRRNSHLREVMIQNCGHDIMAEVPEAFNQTLRHFMMQNQ